MRIAFAGVLFMSLAAFSSAGPASDDKVFTAVRPDTRLKNDHYIGNREPLLPSPLLKLPIGSIRPRGWLKKQLELQAAGFHGRLGEISAYVQKDGNAWLSKEGEGKSGWEELPYWLKGFGDAGYVLGDKRIIDEARSWLEGAIAGQQADGWFGPGEKRTGIATGLKGRADLWPNMIMLYCLQSYHEYGGDRRVIDLMQHYFRYLLEIPAEKLLRPVDWQTHRGGDLLCSIHWLYNRTGESWLLELAARVHANTSRWDRGIPTWHNVNIAQGFRQPGTWYLQSHDPAHLAAAERNWREVRALYGQVPGGMFGSDENCRPGYFDPRQAIETCGMVEEMLSDEILLSASGDPVWADRCEDVAFNSLPASTTADLKALRYLTSPNMPLSDRGSKAPGLQNGGPMLHMNPHDHRCCQHNFGHGWPYFAEHLWMATPGNGLAAIFYADSEVVAKVGGGIVARISSSTHYPFDDRVEISLAVPNPVRFPLHLRVPGWCGDAAVSVNGAPHKVQAPPRSYIVIDREWSDGDKVSLRLPMKIQARAWHQNHDSVSIDRGPLTYSLKIGEKYVRSGGTDAWPAWEILPATPWNYGLVIEAADPARSFETVLRKWPENDEPFTQEGAPVELVAKGRRIPLWGLDRLGLVGKLQDSPARTGEPVEPIRLIPMGAARLRIASFPVAGEGADGHAWVEPPKPLPYAASASHCWQGDTVDALKDSTAPSSSSDASIDRFTWWDHRGTLEWVQYEFDAPKRLSAASVYWFDDTGAGQCRVPVSWRILIREKDEWKPAQDLAGCETAKDRFNEATFRAAEVKGIRLEVQLQKGFSAGILEWRVR